MNKALRVVDYLQHILQAISRIARYTEGLTEADFTQSELVQDAVLRNIEILGEASNNILRASPDFASLHPDIPWQVLYAMRNRVAHGYEAVDLEIVWKTVRRDLPGLEQRIREIAHVAHAQPSDDTPTGDQTAD